MESFKSWNDFLNYKGPHSSKLSLLKSSNLCFTNPKDQRPHIWASLVDPTTANNALDYYKQNSSSPTIPPDLLEQLKKDITKTVSTSINSSEKSLKLLSILSTFYMHFSSFIYNSNIVKISNCLLTVFSLDSDVFVMLVHIYENIYPTVNSTQDFFTGLNNFKVLRLESKVFVEHVKKLRPKTLNSLIIHSKSNNTEKINYEVFQIIMERLSETWFCSLFVTNLMTTDLLRVLDFVFVHGFDFCQKFALVLLSKYEGFFRDALKQEVRTMDMAKNSEFLVFAGNVAKNKLVNKFEKIQVEAMIKKCLTKANYTGLSRDGIRVEVDEEGEISNRIRMMRELRGCLEGYDKDVALKIIGSLEMYGNYNYITRATFTNYFFKNFGWSLETVTKFFVVFDQKGADCLQILNLKLALAMLVKGFTEKCDAIFFSITQDKFPSITRTDFIKLLKALEENFYCWSTFYLKNSQNEVNHFERLEKSSFIIFLNQEKFYQTLSKMLKMLDLEDISMIKAKTSEEISFNISTPNRSSASGLSENDADVSDMIKLELDEEIKVIGNKSLELGITTISKNNSGSLKHMLFKPEEHFESIKIVKDPDYLSTTRNKDMQDEDLGGSLRKVDFDMPSAQPRDKQRNACSRLCSNQNCLAF